MKQTNVFIVLVITVVILVITGCPGLAPDPPANLVVSDAATDSLTLGWDPVDNAVGYRIYRANNSDGPYTKTGPDITELSYIDEGLSPGTTYWYGVSAFNDVGESDKCEARNGTTLEAEVSQTITIGVFEDLETAYTEIFDSDGFKAAFPDVVIQIQPANFGDHHERLKIQIEAGVGANDIEALEIAYIGYFVAANGLTDLAQAPYNGMTAGEDLAPHSMANATTTDGKLIALPVDVAPAVLFYRESIANAYGADFTSLADWSAYITNAQLVTDDFEPDGTIDQFALTHPIDLAMIPLNGGKGDWFDEFDVPYEPESKFKAVLQLMEDVRNAGIDADFSDWTTEWTNSFKDGVVVTHFSGAWMLGNFQYWMCPDLSDWRVAYPPGPTYASYGGSYLCIPEQTPEEKKELAWEIIKYICTNPGAQLISFTSKGIFPALTTVYNDPVITAPIPYLGGQQAGEIFRDIILNIPQQYVTEWDAIAFDIFENAINSVIAGEKTVDEAYDDAKVEMINLM